MNKCYGCGVDLQTKDKEKIGYVTEGALKKEHALCMRCFNIRNYSKNIVRDYEDEQFIEILSNLPKNNLIVMIVDIFDLNSTLLPEIIEIIKGSDVLLFVNKADMLPDDVNIDRLLEKIVTMYVDLDLKIVNGALISAKYHFNIDYAKELIDNYKQDRDIYIVGVSNVGKSQFIESLLTECEILNSNVTVSHFPATTINVLRFKYDDNYIYDTPGVINRSQIIHYIDESDIKYLYPKKLKSIVYQLREGTTLFIGGLLKIDVLSEVAITVFCSELITIHRRKTEGSEQFFIDHKEDILKLNYSNSSLTTNTFSLKADEEIVVNGLCWFKVNDSSAVKLTLHENVGVEVRDKLI